MTLTPSDAGAGVATTYYTTDGSTPDTNSTQGTSIPLSADGVYTIKYFSVDRVGNAEAVQTGASQIRIDAANPSSSTLDALPAAIRNGQVLSGSAADATSGVATVAYYRCAGTSCSPSTLVGSSSTGPSYSVTWNSQPADGDYQVLARATDAAGNTLDSAKQTIKVDNSNPTGSLTSPTGGASLSGTVAVASNSADSVSGVAQVVFQRSPAGAGTWTTIDTDSSAPFSVDWVTGGVTDGDYDLRADDHGCGRQLLHLWERHRRGRQHGSQRLRGRPRHPASRHRLADAAPAGIRAAPESPRSPSSARPQAAAAGRPWTRTRARPTRSPSTRPGSRTGSTTCARSQPTSPATRPSRRSSPTAGSTTPLRAPRSTIRAPTCAATVTLTSTAGRRRLRDRLARLCSTRPPGHGTWSDDPGRLRHDRRLGRALRPARHVTDVAGNTTTSAAVANRRASTTRPRAPRSTIPAPTCAATVMRSRRPRATPAPGSPRASMSTRLPDAAAAGLEPRLAFGHDRRLRTGSTTCVRHRHRRRR